VKDPTAPKPKERKKIMFYDSLDRQTRLRIRCQHDGISQSQFFRIMLSGYIDNHPAVVGYLTEKKAEMNLQGKHKRASASKMIKNSNENIKKFNLDENEIESIFDIIETESGI
tara:strand:- start:3005 stop:3343 length:339 start_codon:yes stop_codon:yes gene_type:complete